MQLGASYISHRLYFSYFFAFFGKNGFRSFLTNGRTVFCPDFADFRNFSGPYDRHTYSPPPKKTYKWTDGPGGIKKTTDGHGLHLGIPWPSLAGNNTYCTASHYLSIMKYQEFHLVSTGALRASTLVSRSSPWTYPPPSSPSFSSLSSSSRFVMGESPWGGVLQHLLLLQAAELFSCTCGLPHMRDKCFSPIPKQTKLSKNKM